MQDPAQRLLQQLLQIDGASDELRPPADAGRLDAAERELGVTLPRDFRHLYSLHNGQHGDLFLFGEFRLYPLEEIVVYHRAALRAGDWNPGWIGFGGNGGNTILCLDLDGEGGQVLELCDGEIDRRYRSVVDFVTALSEQLAAGDISWDAETGSFHSQDPTSLQAEATFRERQTALATAPRVAELRKLRVGEQAALVGMLIVGGGDKHRLYIHDGVVALTGDAGSLGEGSREEPPVVRATVRLLKRRLIGKDVFEIVSLQHLA